MLTQDHLARPMAPIGQGCIAGCPAGVQSHCNWREVVGGQLVPSNEEEDNRLLTVDDGRPSLFKEESVK